jgi:uncharacterized protein (DUF2235 family)
MKNIQDGYRFIVQNYNPGDEVYLFGFSRGAYTVRCLAGMLNNCGVLLRKNADQIPDAFEFYKNRKAKPSSRDAEKWRKKRCCDADRGPVDFIGVWDTVGKLGVPKRVLAFMDERDLFYDHDLGSNVKVARHAVSIDERRADFKPTLWDNEAAGSVKQVWFAGVHADVGGGYKASSKGVLLSDIPLAWMAREAGAAGLEFEDHLYVKSKLNCKAHQHKSYKNFWRVLGREQREIPSKAVMHSTVKNRYTRTDYHPDQLQLWLDGREEKWGEVEP